MSPAGRPARSISASAPSIAANVCPQQPWFLNVIAAMLKTSPSPSQARFQSGPSLMARPRPDSPSIASSDPVTPSRAARAASTPASAARPACSGLDIESMRKACWSPAANVVTVASAWANCSRERSSSIPAAAAAPKLPTVPVVCQWR